MGRWDIGEIRAVLFAVGGQLRVSNVQLVFSRVSEHMLKITKPETESNDK